MLASAGGRALGGCKVRPAALRWRDARQGGSYAICVPLDERLPPPSQSLCCSASPLQGHDTTRRSRSWLPGWRRRRTEAHDGQPPARFGLRQLSTGHACLSLGTLRSRPSGSAGHSIARRPRPLLGRRHPVYRVVHAATALRPRSRLVHVLLE
jgi:hypothetical protein